MAFHQSIHALALAAVIPSAALAQSAPAPEGTATTRYCMRVTLTGHVIEPIRCWTRDQWAEQGVDLDREWAREGVKVIG